MRCKRGFTGDDCSQPSAPVVRRNILSLTKAERDRIIEIFKMTKSVEESGYTVPIREPITATPRDSFVEISLYDIFATFHYNTIRDEQINKCPSTSLIHQFCNEENKCPVPDFAHAGPSFLPWHRGYLLYVETEIQKMLDNPTFALPYWDWTDENRRDEIWDLYGKSNCGIFFNPENNYNETNPENNYNETNPENNYNETVGNPFDRWKTICTNFEEIICNENNQVCNPTENLKDMYIQRCIGGTEGIQCRVESTLPSIGEVNVALLEQSYDTHPYGNSYEQGGFRIALEGFKKLKKRNENVCQGSGEDFKYTELHNRVHIYIGGTMLDVPTASNDPIFFLHHCNVDRLYEKWLIDKAGFPGYQPVTFNYDVAPGHNINEYLVPMFPLITNREMHRRATSLGYTYEEKNTTDNPQGTTDNPQGTTNNPQDTTDKPQGTTGNPQGTTNKPQGTTKKPQGTTDRPQDTTDKPQGGGCMKKSQMV